MREHDRISEGPDYSVSFDNFVGMKMAGRNAGQWQALVLKSPDSARRTKMMIPAEVAFGPKQRRAAEKWREERDGKIREGTEVAENIITLHDRLDRYEARRRSLLERGKITQSTFDKTTYGLRPIRTFFVDADGRPLRLQAIRKDTVEDFMEELLRGELSSAKRTKERGQLGGSQAAQSLRILKKVLEDAFDNDLVRKNYARNVEPPAIEVERILYLARPEHVDALVEAAEKHCPKWAPGLFAFWGHTGARKMEGASLWWKDIDHTSRKVSIQEQLDEDKLTRRELKTRASVRTIDLDPRLDPYLGREALLRSRSSTFVFTTRERTPVTSNHQRYLDIACQKAGLARLTPHMLRHSFATRLIYEGTPINEVTRIMGHKNSKITLDTYTHCWDDQGHVTYEWPESVAV